MAANEPTHVPGASDESGQLPPADAIHDEPNADALDGSSTNPPEPNPAPAAPDRQETVISRRRPDMIAALGPSMDSSPLLEGETLGHFRLEQFVGGGGMGTVYRAVDTMLDRTVAVKVLARDHSNDELLQRFQNEAQSDARLDHDNIARVHYVGEDKGVCYIVFEFIEGDNIRDLVAKRGPLPLDEAIRYTLAVAEALEHAYHRDVVHRDIKPSNVLITPEGHVKLVDMGLARLHQVEAPDHDLTASGVTLGTFDYISPEQARDPRSADVRSDIYSLGCTLYFMLTGRPPFPDGTVLQKLLSHTSDERPDPRLYRPELPEEISAILNKMLAKHPDQRYQEPSALIGEMLLTAEFLGLESATNGGTVWITPRVIQPGVAKRLIPVLVPVLVLVLAVTVLDRILPSSSVPDDHKLGQPNLQPGELVTPAGDQTNKIEDPNDGNKVSPKVNGEQVVKDGTKDDVPPEPGTRTPRVVENGHDPGPVEQPSVGNPPFVLEPTSLEIQLGPEDIAAAISAEGRQIEAAVNPSTNTVAQISAADIQHVPSQPVDGDPTFVVVADADQIVRSGAKVVESLAAAVQFASAHPEIKKIELHFNGPRLEEPFDTSVQSLTIKAGTNFEPVLVFRPLADTAHHHMMEFVGSSIEWSGVHFVFDLPQGNKRKRWSLFHLDQIKSLAMGQCTLTIRNTSADNEMRQTGVSFFEIKPPPPAPVPAVPGGKQVVARPSLTLSGCVARGEAVFVSGKTATPFTLTWKEGLFVTNQTLVELGGTDAKPEWADRIKVFLTNVTAFMDGGMCLLRSHPDAPHTLGLTIDCNKCILMADSMSPLIEHLEVTDLDETIDRSLTFQGSQNFFPSSNIVWRLSPAGGQSKVKQFDLDSAVAEPWFKEMKESDRVEMVSWAQVPADDKPIHVHSVKDYLLDEKVPANPAVLMKAGFQISLPVLPKIPVVNAVPLMKEMPKPEPAAALTPSPIEADQE